MLSCGRQLRTSWHDFNINITSIIIIRPSPSDDSLEILWFTVEHFVNRSLIFETDSSSRQKYISGWVL